LRKAHPHRRIRAGRAREAVGFERGDGRRACEQEDLVGPGIADAGELLQGAACGLLALGEHGIEIAIALVDEHASRFLELRRAAEWLHAAILNQSGDRDVVHPQDLFRIGPDRAL